MEKNSAGLPHKLTLEARNKLVICGVTEVLSFDDGAVALRTDLGELLVHGNGLQLKTLSPEGGQVTVEGNVSSLVYEEPRVPGGWLRRLLG